MSTSKIFKVRAKVWESSSGLPCLRKAKQKVSYSPIPPHTPRFPASPPDANWQTEGMYEINNHTNKRRGRTWNNQRTKGKKGMRDRERESGNTTHQRSSIISWGTRWREENKIAICPPPLYLCLFFSLQFIRSRFFFACLSIRTWLWELLPQDLWSWKSLGDLSPNPSF